MTAETTSPHREFFVDNHKYNDLTPEERILCVLRTLKRPVSTPELCALTGLERFLVLRQIKKLRKWHIVGEATTQKVAYWRLEARE